MGVASLVLGIVSILVSVFTAGTIGWLGVILGVVGIILGALARKTATNSIPMAGLICSIIGVALGLVLFIACAACIAGTGVTSAAIVDAASGL